MQKRTCEIIFGYRLASSTEAASRSGSLRSIDIVTTFSTHMSLIILIHPLVYKIVLAALPSPGLDATHNQGTILHTIYILILQYPYLTLASICRAFHASHLQDVHKHTRIAPLACLTKMCAKPGSSSSAMRRTTSPTWRLLKYSAMAVAPAALKAATLCSAAPPAEDATPLPSLGSCRAQCR